MDFPKLRALEAFPVSVAGRSMIGLRDPLNFSPGTIAIPRYYIPLTIKGKIALKLNIHNGVRGIIPEIVKGGLKDLRKKFYNKKYSKAHKV